MMYHKKPRKVFYHVLEGSRYLLADERDKKKFLDILFSAEKEEDWLIYAFCLTDNCAYFVIEAEGVCSVRRGVQYAVNRFLAGYRRSPDHRGERGAAFRSGPLEEIDTLAGIAARCRQIHKIPLEKGYVSRLDDYWWSSYITYAGEYEWELVDCRILLLCFSANPETARRRLLKFHQ